MCVYLKKKYNLKVHFLYLFNRIMPLIIAIIYLYSVYNKKLNASFSLFINYLLSLIVFVLTILFFSSIHKCLLASFLFELLFKLALDCLSYSRTSQLESLLLLFTRN